jgi:hypothetical protein
LACVVVVLSSNALGAHGGIIALAKFTRLAILAAVLDAISVPPSFTFLTGYATFYVGCLSERTRKAFGESSVIGEFSNQAIGALYLSSSIVETTDAADTT